MIRLTIEEMLRINKKQMLNKKYINYDVIYADTDSVKIKEKNMVEHIMPEPILKQNTDTTDEMLVLKKSLVEAQAEIQRLNEIIKFLTVEKDKAELITQQTLHALKYLKGKMDEQR